MSRIIIKNLPKKISEEKVKKIFGEKGLITDVQLKYTPEGNFRRFAFIGYQNEDEASEAIKYFNNTRIDTSKIIVESCALLGDKNKPRAWSKYTTDSTAYQKKHVNVEKEQTEHKKDKKKKKDTTAELLEKHKDDPLFEEFIQVQAPKEAEKLFKKIQNTEESKCKSETESESESEDEQEDKLANKDISDLEYMRLLKKPSDNNKSKPEKSPKEKKQLFTVKLKELPCKCKKKDIKQFFKPLTPYSIRVPRGIKGIAYVGFKQEKQLKKALLKDKSFMSGKQVVVKKFDSVQEDERQIDPNRNRWKEQEDSLKNEEDIAESGRIFVRNLAYTTAENDIEELFSKFGPISEVTLPVDPNTGNLKGFGIITFLLPEHAVKAYTELDGSILHGRMLHLLPGKSKDTPEGTESMSYKDKKAAKLKAQSNASRNWNSLFVGQNAVVEVMAKTYGTTKDNILDPFGDSDVAVRLALGETQIVLETKKYLEEHGVILDAFSGNPEKKSKNVILVKNLPAGTQANELEDIFGKHGKIGRFIFPPSGLSAIVEYLSQSEAKHAYSELAYSKFKHLPLYLEMAPENSLKPSKPVEHSNNNTENNEEETKEDVNETETNVTEEKKVEEPEPDTTLFVKNLNFNTSDEALRKHFEKYGKIHNANVSLKKDKTQPGKRLSMGYGFVRFMHKKSADKALKSLQQSTLDGKTLEIKRSEQTSRNDALVSNRKVQTNTKQTGTKILIRNVPFQVKLKEIRELFKNFGEIKAVRLPKKLTLGSEEQHRGFAFVDFFSKEEAKKAFEALSQSTHLYGRRLVFEWASTDDSVDSIRKRTADHFHPTKEVKSKKSLFSIDEL